MHEIVNRKHLYIVNFRKCYFSFPFASYRFTLFSDSYSQVTHGQDFINLINIGRKERREGEREGMKEKFLLRKTIQK